MDLLEKSITSHDSLCFFFYRDDHISCATRSARYALKIKNSPLNRYIRRKVREKYTRNISRIINREN